MGISTGIRKGLKEDDGNLIKDDTMQERRIIVEEETWRILTVYKGEGIEKIKRKIDDKIEDTKEENLVIGGDFNARIGEEGRIISKPKRNSKDKTKNEDGNRLLQWVEDRGWNILNGNILGDEHGEYTYNGPKGEDGTF
ncbi:hypothetical protein CBL_00350 [Carabus blaptoides fortunei]